MTPLCLRCGGSVSRDAEGLYRKIVNRNAENFLCIDCLAAQLCIEPEALLALVERFRRAGCSLFQ